MSTGAGRDAHPIVKDTPPWRHRSRGDPQRVVARPLLLISTGGISMAHSDTDGGATGSVAIFAILLMILFVGFVAWRAGVFGNSGASTSLDLNIHTPGSR
jgi:hypothetical protein